MTRVLIIEDDLSVGEALQMMLARQGCDAVLAPDAYAGMQAFEASTFDSVIVDIFMPGMDGLETITKIRRRSQTIQILAISGFKFRDSMGAGLDYLTMAIKIGASAYLRKPFSPQQLMAAITSGLGPASPSDRLVKDQEPRQGSTQ